MWLRLRGRASLRYVLGSVVRCSRSNATARPWLVDLYLSPASISIKMTSAATPYEAARFVSDYIDIFRSSWVAVDASAFSPCPHIRGLSAKAVFAISHYLKMIGIDTRSVTTKMVDSHPLWNLSFKKSVGETVRQFWAAILPGLGDRPISGYRITACGPNPASRWAEPIYLLPETLGHRSTGLLLTIGRPFTIALSHYVHPPKMNSVVRSRARRANAAPAPPTIPYYHAWR